MCMVRLSARRMNEGSRRRQLLMCCCAVFCDVLRCLAPTNRPSTDRQSRGSGRGHSRRQSASRQRLDHHQTVEHRTSPIACGTLPLRVLWHLLSRSLCRAVRCGCGGVAGACVSACAAGVGSELHRSVSDSLARSAQARAGRQLSQRRKRTRSVCKYLHLFTLLLMQLYAS
jgi:hypothetical protein